MEYQEWERNFRAAAKADGYAIFRDHLRRLKLPDSPELLLEGTILAVRATCAYRLLDNSDGKYVDQLLEMQHYNPADSTNAHYAYTFDIYGDTYARVLVESGSEAIDLADLFNHPWEEYKVAGFTYLFISRTDWSGLTSEEVRQLEDDVTADLRSDYGEEEVGFWFDQPDGNTSLMMYIYDEPGEEEKYQLLKERSNSASGLEISFLDFLYQGGYRLPDEAQRRPCPDLASQPDFLYMGDGVSGACLFVDGSDDVDPTRKERDMAARTALEDRGYRVIVIRFDLPLEEQVSQHADIFGKGS